MLPSKPKPLAICIGLCLSQSLPAAVAAQTAAPGRIETMLVRGKQIKLAIETEQALTPGAVTLLDSDELYRRNVATLADMLRYVPGVWVANGTTADSTFFSSRGSNLDATNYDGNGIKLLQDGLPVTAADGNNHNRMVDPLASRYAIVAHGANALTYGASTLGGAIDFITPTARDTKSQVYLSGGSHGNRQGRVTLGTVAGDFDGLVTLETRRADGWRDHQAQRREGLYANAGWRFGDAVRSRIYLTYIDNDQELPGALSRGQWRDDPEQAEAAAVAGDYQYNVRSWRIANKTEWDIDENSSLSVGVSFEDQSLYHPIVSSPFFSLLIDTGQKNAGLSLRYDLRLGEHDVLAGLNYGRTTVEGGNYRHQRGHRNGLAERVDNDADSLELFVVDRWQFAPQWTLVYGVQGVVSSREVRNTDVADGALRNPKDDYDSINPRLGLIHRLTPEVELYANLSRLYEAPTTYELDDDVRGDDQTLNAMRGTVLEVGSRGRQALGAASHWHWDVALYYARLKDEILSVDAPQAPGTSLSTNVDDTRHAGIEALIGASFALDDGGVHRIEPLLNLTVNEFSFDGDPNYGDNDLPAAPGYFIKGEILYRHANGFYAGPTFDYVDERYADFANTYTVDSYALLGLRTGFRGKHWEVWGELRNLTDRDYIALFSVKDAAGPDAAILNPGEPRSAYVGVKWQF